MRNEGVFIGGWAFDITSHYARSACHSMVGQGGQGRARGLWERFRARWASCYHYTCVWVPSPSFPLPRCGISKHNEYGGDRHAHRCTHTPTQAHTHIRRLEIARALCLQLICVSVCGAGKILPHSQAAFETITKKKKTAQWNKNEGATGNDKLN